MNIFLSSAAHNVAFFLNENFLPSLTTQQKKILLIASAVFAFVTACYVISIFYFKAKPLKDEAKSQEDQIR